MVQSDHVYKQQCTSDYVPLTQHSCGVSCANDPHAPVFLWTVASAPVALVTGASLVHDACSTHVASVVQMTHMIMCHGGVMNSGAMDGPQRIATYWSALVHDHEHGGMNDDFLIKTFHPLAVTYK